MVDKPLIAIVGPTASGKTSLAIELAEEFGGEIICADSRTIYKYMNIGTAKPTAKEQARVRHWGLDLVEPDQSFSAADFKRYADERINDIRSRGKVPFLVGGTGLYIDSVLYDFEFGPVADQGVRKAFESMTIDQLHEYCKQHNILLPENSQNKRYVIRAIERKSITNTRKSELRANSYIVGIATNICELRTRIVTRAEHLFEQDVASEATMLGKKYGWNHESMTGNIYPILKSYLENELTLVDAVDKFATTDWQLAKRQMTWFRRNPDIMWATLTEAKSYGWRLLASE